jgi:SpoIID/LytB domain protein
MILNHYYGNTAMGAVSNLQVSVWLKRQDNVPLIVYSAAVFTLRGIAVNGTAMVRQEGANWVLYRAAPGVSCNQAWGPPTVLGPIGQPVDFVSSVNPGDNVANMLGVCSAEGIRHYRGWLRLLHSTVPRTDNMVPLESYLRGVVPRESPASWPPAPLQAQAVAARSYAMAEGGESEPRFAWAKTCDDVACQVYGGAGLNGTRIEHANTDAAVAATAGQVRRFGNGVLARTEFSSSTGGYTNGTPQCSACQFPSVPDAGDTRSPYHNWTASIPNSTIEARYGLGTLVTITVTRRNGLGDGGGRALEVRMTGSARTVTVTGNEFRSAFGLRSDWFFLTLHGVVWYLRNSNTAGQPDVILRYGNRGDRVLFGDWDGDGTAGIGAFLNGWWFLRNSPTTGPAEMAFRYGNPGDLPVVGDWNGDGRDGIGTFRGGMWYLRNTASAGSPEGVIRYGNTGDTPVVGDWDGVGGDAIGTFLNGWWFLRYTASTGSPNVAFRYGNPGDTPVPGDWNGDGVTSVGTVLNGTWYLRNAPRSGGGADVPAFAFGLRGDRFLTGDFDGNGTDTPAVVRGT